MPFEPTDPITRLLRRIEINPITGCWEWQGAVNPDGYARIEIERRIRHSGYIHRFAYETWVGPIHPGFEIDHLCRVRRCCNPDHLEPVTQYANNMRSTSPTAINAAKTHCKHGHEFTPENTYIGRPGKRVCRCCRKRPI
jgi:hypothetical protein